MIRSWLRTALIGLIVVGSLALGWSGEGPEAAQAGQPGGPAPTPRAPAPSEPGVKLLVPDLVIVDIDDLRLEYADETGRRILRFSTTIGNIGDGPIEVRGRPALQSGRYRVSQRLYGSDGQVLVEPVVEQIVYHSDHAHWHLASFASYEVWRATFDGRLIMPVEVRGKISYCLFDDDPGAAAAERGYETCEPELQGISSGWTDTYASDLADQWVDLTGLKDGVYVLRSVVNPRGVLRERTRENNDLLFSFRLEGLEFSRAPLHPDPWSALPPHPDGG